MAAIVYQTCKETGIVYAYESISYWSKEKKQSRARRKLLGQVDPTTKEIIPTRKRGTGGDPKTKEASGSDSLTFPFSASRHFYGATYLFDAIGEKLGITEDLKKCFPDTYQQLLSTAYYLILEDKNALSRFPKWSALHQHPYGKNILSQRSSELFSSITEEAREYFFRLQGKRRIEQEYWAYDTTSISSYSQGLSQLRYGLNKEGDRLPQINLALLFGESSNLPFYYRKLAGNISDVKTVQHLLADMNFLGYDQVKLVMDRGFYREVNISDLCQHHLKFLIAGKVSLKLVKTELDQVRESLRSWNHYHPEYDLYACTRTITWTYEQERPCNRDPVPVERRTYLHLYLNSEKALEDEKSLNELLCRLQTELTSGKRNPDHEKQYEKYFIVKTTSKKGVTVTTVTAKQEVMDEAKKNYGYFALLSNDIKDPILALEIYRNKDLVEKAFGNLKERLNFRRPGVSSDQSLDGKLFVEFIALIYLSYLKKKMQEKKLFQHFTMQEVLDELDIIECFEQSGKKLRVGEITKKQQELYEAMDITPPTSLH